MATYQIHFKANPVLWPSNPKDSLAAWEQTSQGGDTLLATGAMQEIRMVSASEGYARLEAESATAALAICATFFPLFTQEIQELVPWEVAKDTILGAVRQAAGE